MIDWQAEYPVDIDMLAEKVEGFAASGYYDEYVYRAAGAAARRWPFLAGFLIKDGENHKS